MKPVIILGIGIIVVIILIVGFFLFREKKEKYEETTISGLGESMKKYFTYLLRNPVPYVEYNRARLNYLIDLTEKGVTARQALCISNLAGPQSAYGYDRVEPGPFSFPRDHGPHFGIRAGWIFFFANVWSKENRKGKPISVVYVIKRRAITPPFIWEGKDPLENQTVSVYASVTIPEQGIRSGKSMVVWGGDPSVVLQAQP